MKHNFSAGPSILPKEVFAEAAQAVQDFSGMGLSILEISHRSKEFVAVLDEAVALVKELLNVPDTHAVLYLTGGASSQFFMAPMNILKQNETAAYVDTGTWSTKAIKEAKLFGNIDVVASSKESGYNQIPKSYQLADGTRFLHYTSNNTIYGTQYQQPPAYDIPFVCDMSSDIFSKPVNVSQYDLIYAGAQKNMGPAGTTLVIVRKSILGQIDRQLTSMLNYETHINKNSSFNTPPVFPIYVSMLNLRWLKKNGGVAAAQGRNEKKAAALYDVIVQYDLYKGHAVKGDRSLMNVTFTLADDTLNEAFLAACTAAGCSGVKGHRSVGGFRASIYNAMPLSSVEVLRDVMVDFAQKNG